MEIMLKNVDRSKYEEFVWTAGEHLSSEIHTHTKLLMEWITNSQNDSESLKREMKQLMKDNNEMKEKLKLNEERFQVKWFLLKLISNCKIYQNQREDVERLKSENNEMKEKMGTSEVK